MEIRTIKLIQIDWQGPFSLDELNQLNDIYHDYGIYQIYGKHTVYGKDVLLYIGKADQQTIGKRVSQENWWDTNDSGHLKIYAGRLAGESTPEEDMWSKEIELAEKLLINVHKPAYNSKSLSSIPDFELQDIHILNWGDYRDLLPEVSGLRWTSKLDHVEYDTYRIVVTE
ncbi:GIY-YIG nuclease family protein [Bacillus sp. FJAT-49711]|uniref:GIY-YIG nuclease family protein n=1 Tax=Bacillus sp. FJAT-49711 TaxID=2833585 RepID=UPI001BC9D16E|nr:GIY-YIG nuclease family protein [Bacillus sp. FJAT-49711]MBS4220082.1 GIY-YIG nuclease family protein [Bacillus sp. FJAT-49711]